MSKGSKSRITDKKRYDREYDRIYGRRKKNENFVSSASIQPAEANGD